MKNETIKLARRNMRAWAKHWRTARYLRDKQGMETGLTRAVIWRETSVTLTHQHSTN